MKALSSNGTKQSKSLILKGHCQAHWSEYLSWKAIACGAMGFPLKIAARIALETVSSFLLSSLAIGSVAFVCADKETLQYYQEAFKRIVAW